MCRLLSKLKDAALRMAMEKGTASLAHAPIQCAIALFTKKDMEGLHIHKLEYKCFSAPDADESRRVPLCSVAVVS